MIGQSPDLKINSTSQHCMSNAESIGFVSSDSKNSLSQLLGYDTITSVEELSGSLASKIDMNQSGTEEDHNKLIHISESISGAMSAMSSKSSLTSESNTDPFITSSSNNSLVMVSKNMRQSPWKLVEHSKQADNGDEIGEDSVSIEVDSIEEDDPPSEFKVETTCVQDTVKLDIDNKCCDLDTKRQQLEHQCCTGEHLIAENNSCLCYCEKAYQPEFLTLIFKFRLRDGVMENEGGRLGSLLIEQNHYDITTEVCDLIYSLIGIYSF